jgi:hypothetical protein
MQICRKLKLKIGQVEMKATVSAIIQEMRSWREETKAYPEKQEANPEEMKSIAEHQEVPKEEAAVNTVRASKKRYGGPNLTVGRRWQLKKRTQGDGTPCRKLAAIRGWLTRRAIPAPRKGHGRQELCKDDLRGTSKEGRSRRDIEYVINATMG